MTRTICYDLICSVIALHLNIRIITRTSECLGLALLNASLLNYYVCYMNFPQTFFFCFVFPLSFICATEKNKKINK